MFEKHCNVFIEFCDRIILIIVLFQAHTLARISSEKTCTELASIEKEKNSLATENMLLKEKLSSLGSAKDEATLEAKHIRKELNASRAEVAELKTGLSRLEAAEAKIASLEKDNAALKHDRSTRNYGFAAQAISAHQQYCEALGYVGAEPMSLTDGAAITEAVFFGWRKSEFEALLGVMDKHGNFSALHTAEAAFGLLEREGCDHFHALGRRNFSIGVDARDGLSPEAITAAKRVAMKFWCDHGRSAAR